LNFLSKYKDEDKILCVVVEPGSYGKSVDIDINYPKSRIDEEIEGSYLKTEEFSVKELKEIMSRCANSTDWIREMQNEGYPYIFVVKSINSVDEQEYMTLNAKMNLQDIEGLL